MEGAFVESDDPRPLQSAIPRCSIFALRSSNFPVVAHSPGGERLFRKCIFSWPCDVVRTLARVLRRGPDPVHEGFLMINYAFCRM